MTAQFKDAVDDAVVAVLHLEVFEGIKLLVVIAEIGVGKVVVVGFAQVQHATHLPVHIFYDRHVRLHIEVDARALDDGFERRIDETGVVAPDVVSAIAEEQGLAADIGLLREEGEVEAVLSVKRFARLQFERTVLLGTGVAARNLDVYVLIEQHFALRREVAEIHGTVPRLIVILRLGLSVARLAVGAVAIAVEAYLGVGEIFLIANDADDRERILVGCLYEAAGDRHAGQVSVLIETEHIVGGF